MDLVEKSTVSVDFVLASLSQTWRTSMRFGSNNISMSKKLFSKRWLRHYDLATKLLKQLLYTGILIAMCFIGIFRTKRKAKQMSRFLGADVEYVFMAPKEKIED